MVSPPALTNKIKTDIILTSIIHEILLSDKSGVKNRGRIMKKMRFFCLILAFFLLIGAVNMPVHATSADPAVTNGCHSVDAAMTLSTEEKLTDTAKAAMIYELNSGTMLYAHNPDEKIYPTSMVKMMTVLAILECEYVNLDETVTVTREMRRQVPIGIVGMDLSTDEEFSLRDLLYATMVASATDASVVAAMHVGGSINGFLQMMNDKAAQLGCRNTHYGNVHGLHDEQTYTTARDICRITEAALKNETFRTMFCTVEYTIPATNKHEARKLTTTNNMMNPRNSKYFDERVTGGKTGATDEGGRCLTMTANHDGMDLLCIVMGAKPTLAANGSLDAYGSFEESKVLMDYAFEKFAFRQVFFDGQSLAQYPVENGTSHVVTQAAMSVSTVIPVDVEESQLQWIYTAQNATVLAPVEKGQKLGTVQVWYGTKCLAQTDMTAMHAVAEYQAPVIPEMPEHHGIRWGAVALIILLVLVAGFLVLLGLRMASIRKYRRRQRRRSPRR